MSADFAVFNEHGVVPKEACETVEVVAAPKNLVWFGAWIELAQIGPDDWAWGLESGIGWSGLPNARRERGATREDALRMAADALLRECRLVDYDHRHDATAKERDLARRIRRALLSPLIVGPRRASLERKATGALGGLFAEAA